MEKTQLKNNDTLQKFCNFVLKGNVEENKKLKDSKCIQDFIISSSGLNYDAFMEAYDFSPFQLKKIVVGIRRILRKNPQLDILKIAAALSKKLYGKKIAFSDSNYFDDKGKIQNYNFSFIMSDTEASSIFCSSFTVSLLSSFFSAMIKNLLCCET